ncbi:hypothetical protein [Arcobacter sp. s6]|uniref:hypothetical protein n=1 Tax=Arcobacter sp. s6 TaxID=3230363 RepID=UPI00349FE71A
MDISKQQELINSQLLIVKEPILIENVINGDNTKVYVEFKGRSSRFLINEELGNSINTWLNNLPVITVNEMKEVMNKYNISLEKISELLEDEELIKIENIEEWINTYNEQDCFLPIDVIDRIIEVNL